MKFVIATQELNYLISKCLNVVSPKATIPILSNILIEAAEGELVLTATDLTVGVRCQTEAKVLEEGSITVPAKRFAQLMRELTATNVEISTHENDIVEVTADSSRFKLHGMNRSEFPSLPDMSGATHFSIPQDAIKDMFYRTSFSVSREDNRYVLTGVCMQIADGHVSFAGTDGKRLSRAQLSIDLDPSFSGSYVIPLKAVEEIMKNLTDEGEAKVSLMHDKVAVDAADTMIISKLLTGDYPDVSRVIPENSETIVSIHRDELITLLRQISLFTVDNNHSVRFSFNEGELKLTANTMDVGEGRVSMPINYHGSKLDVAFNPSYFLDILRHSKGETVTMGITDPFNPGVVIDQENAGTISSSQSPLFVLMPMRLNEE